MRSRLFFGSGSEYRSQHDVANDDGCEEKVIDLLLNYDKSMCGHYNLPQTKTQKEVECGYCGKMHRFARKFCSITCARGFIKTQQRKGNFADD